MKKIGLFGCGSLLDVFFDTESCEDVVVIFDNFSKDTSYQGVPICKAEKLLEFDLDSIVITSRHYADIKKQIYLMGFPKEKIFIYPAIIELI